VVEAVDGRLEVLVDGGIRRGGDVVKALALGARAQTREEEVALVPIELEPFLRRVAAGETPDQVLVEAAGAPPALAQPDLLEQVVANLVANAIKHAPDGAIYLRAAAEGDHAVVISVSDTGPGIPADIKVRMFDRFYAGGGASRVGFGLGLAIARDSAVAMRGRLEIESELGAGTIARVILQRA